MKLIIPGGSGQVGTLIARNFHQDGHEVIVLSRNPVPAPWKVLPWDAKSLGDWASEFERADVTINMAGRSVNCRYGDNNRREIIDSACSPPKLSERQSPPHPIHLESGCRPAPQPSTRTVSMCPMTNSLESLAVLNPKLPTRGASALKSPKRGNQLSTKP